MKEKVSPSILKHSLSFNPWVFFIIFLASNTLLSFYPFPLQTQFFIVFFGLILPFIAGYQIVTERKNQNASPPVADSGPVPFWLWFIFIAFVLFTRFYHLTSLPSWLYIDEGYESALGMGLLSHWDWRLLWSPVPHEPLLDWLLGFYFKICPPSLFSFRLFSTLISLATITAGYWASRAVFSRRVSFLFAVILAFCYWSFTLSRLGIVVILIPLIQCFGLGCLGRLLRAQSHSVRWWAWAGLTAANILGFYSWTNWAGLGLAISFILLIYYFKNPKLSKAPLWSFYGVSAIGVFPLVLARLAPGALSHIGQIYHFNPLKAFIYNIVGIFWDGSATFNFGSLWGGFLNPIIDSLALLGALFFFQRKITLWQWLVPAVVFISLLPALSASSDVELYRTLPVLVFLTLAAAAGLNGLLKLYPGRLNTAFVFSLLFASIGLDIYNYTAFYSNNRYIPEELQWRSNAYAQAYQTLNQLQRQSGPLYVFSQFTTEYDNRTIDVALYPFNVLQNPVLNDAHPQWTAVMTNVNYIPFLVKAYPHAQVTLLKKAGDPSKSSNFIALVILPTNDISAATLSQWKEADAIFRKINLYLLNKNPITPWDDIANSFPPLSQNTKADPLARAIYWEKVGLFHFQGKNFKEAAEDYRRAIQQGYPAAHLQYNLSVALKSIENKK